jgi:hypothetical protein
MSDLVKRLRSGLDNVDGDELGGLVLRMNEAADKIEGLEADLENAVETAFKRGATEWTLMNYPDLYARFNAK